MQDKKGRLSLEQRTLVAEAVTNSAQHEGDPCPHCGNTNTSVAQDLFRIAVVDAPIPTRFIPIVPVICNNCGFVRMFGARQFGIEADASLTADGGEGE